MEPDEFWASLTPGEFVAALPSAFRALHDEVRAMELEWRQRGRRDVMRGGDLSRDNTALVAFGWVASDLADVSRRVAVDNLGLYLRSVLRGEWPAYAGFSLLRAALEAAAHGVWLLTPNSDHDRLWRAASLLISDRRYAIDALVEHKIEVPDDLEHLDASTLQTNLNLTSKPARVGSLEVTREVGRELPAGSELPALWMACSGYAHAKPWAIKFLSDKNRLSPPELPGTFHSAPLGLSHSAVRVAALLLRELNRLYDLRRAAPAP